MVEVICMYIVSFYNYIFAIIYVGTIIMLLNFE
jgi:hypothetical protein